MDEYLASSPTINWQHKTLLSKAKNLAANRISQEEVARACFEFVRDDIKHSYDYKQNPVTCRASDVLLHGTGYCFAKSHLLAALLRANGIPSGLCYQRLTIDNNVPPFCLHGLNSVHLPEFGWYRLDARGNKQGVNAEFNPPVEQLAFPIAVSGEKDIEGIWAEPLPEVIHLLKTSKTIQEVATRISELGSLKTAIT